MTRTGIRELEGGWTATKQGAAVLVAVALSLIVVVALQIPAVGFQARVKPLDGHELLERLADDLVALAKRLLPDRQWQHRLAAPLVAVA